MSINDGAERIPGQTTAPSVWTKIDSGFDRLARVMELVLGAAFIFAVMLNFVSVVDRNIFSQSIIGADEVQLYIMVWMTFFGAPIVTWRHQHLRMDVLVTRLPKKWRVVLLCLELILITGLATLLMSESSKYTMLMRTIDRRSDLANLPLWIPHSALAIGFGLIALMSVYRLVALCVARFQLEEHPSEVRI